VFLFIQVARPEHHMNSCIFSPNLATCAEHPTIPDLILLTFGEK